MSGKINVTDVITDHFRTLRDERTGRLSLGDVFTFFAIPLALLILFLLTDFTISDAAIPTIITALSIFAGLMINVLILIYTVSQNVDELSHKRGKEDVESEKRFLREIFANISFSILVCIASVVVLIFMMWLSGQHREILSAVAIAMIANFVLTLMMTVKRIHLLLGMRFR